MSIFNSNVWVGQEARDALQRGVMVVAEAVAPTLGSRGTNAVLEEPVYPGHIVTNDGISIAQKVELDHPVERMGANIMKEVADRANKESGDGTTTAMVLTKAILVEGQAERNASPMELKRSLDECVPLVEAAIKEQTKAIDVHQVAEVASVAAEDKEMGQTLQSIYEEIGKDGIMELDVSGTFETSWEVTDGVRLRGCGFMAPYMANQGARAVHENARVMVVRQRIATVNDLDHMFKELVKDSVSELVMFVDDIDMSVLQALAYTHANGIFKTTIVKVPTLWKDWLFDDVAAITGATIIQPSSGVPLKEANLRHLGTAGKIVITREETVVTGIQGITEHIARIAEEKAEGHDLRLAWLKTRAAVLRLGAQSESELAYKRLKAEDARNASHMALKGGIVPGGGVALFRASDKMPDTPGGRILRNALRAPLVQIMKNAGETDLRTGEFSAGDRAEGYDANTRRIVNMWDAGIVDPALVVLNSFKNAVSVAGTVLTSDVVVTLPKKA